MRKRIVSFFIVLISIYPFLIRVNAQTTTTLSKNGKMRIASCQFPVSGDKKANYQFIIEQMIEAKRKRADVVHFPECALTGYTGPDLKDLENFNWDELHRMTDSIVSLAKRLKLWVILGSIHRLSGNNKPHNSLYVIDPEGKVADRYDKRFCTSGDLKYFTPGDHFVTFKINGVTCGLLICFDYRFPELYREYRKLGCDLIFHSFYQAREEINSIRPIISHITEQAHAATNYFYISLSNSSAPQSWPCYFITPDGLVKNKLTENIPGVLISDIDLTEEYFDASKEFRPDALRGKLNNGITVSDPLSSDRTGY
jgi:deaminated glutathione amidase